MDYFCCCFWYTSALVVFVSLFFSLLSLYVFLVLFFFSLRSFSFPESLVFGFCDYSFFMVLGEREREQRNRKERWRMGKGRWMREGEATRTWGGRNERRYAIMRGVGVYF